MSETEYRPGYETAAERILEFIAAGQLRAGDRLPTEQNLASELGISRSVTREAVKVLAALGRVSAQRGRGLYVGASGNVRRAPSLETPPFVPGDPDQVEELLRFRQIQDVAAAYGAAQRATPLDLRAIRAIAQSGRQALAGEGTTTFEADTSFHLAVAAASQNRFLSSAIANARQLQLQVVILGFRGGSCGDLTRAQTQHEAICAAVSAGDAAGAANAASAHIEQTITDFRTALFAALSATQGPHTK